MASDITLGIDVGSTETRGVLAWLEDGGEIDKWHVQNVADERPNLNSATWFNSGALVFDGDGAAVYIGNARRSGREETSAKFFPYILVDYKEDVMIQYPILDRLFQERDRLGQEVFCHRLEEAFKQLLRSILQAAKRLLESQNFEKKKRIRICALTIPSQWDLDFEEVYGRLHGEVFYEVFADTPELVADNVAVEFHSEALSLAHYMFRAMSDPDHPFGLQAAIPSIATIVGKLNAQCLIDLGGHNANSTLTQFLETNDGKGCLSLLRNPKGAGGGCEILIYHLLNRAVLEYTKKYPFAPEISRAAREDMKDHITTNLGDVVDAEQFILICPSPRGEDPGFIKVTAEMCEQAFEEAFQHVKAMVEKQLKELANIKNRWAQTNEDHITTIIVSGGSSLHPLIRRWINERCNELGLEAPVYTSEMDIFYGPCRIATGAAYASLTTTADVASFAANSAFALQRGTPTPDGDTLDMENSAKTLWHRKKTHPVWANATGNTAEYRIVCQPVLRHYIEELSTDENTAEGSSYDFLVLGKLPDCEKYRVEFYLNVEKAQVEVKLFRLNSNRKSAKETVIPLGPYPVHVQPDSGNLVINQLSQDDIDQTIKDAFEPYEASTDDASSDNDDYDDAGDDDDDDDDYDARGQAKRSSTKAKTPARKSRSRATASNAAGRAGEARARSLSASMEDGAQASDPADQMQEDAPDNSMETAAADASPAIMEDGDQAAGSPARPQQGSPAQHSSPFAREAAPALDSPNQMEEEPPAGELLEFMEEDTGVAGSPDNMRNEDSPPGSPMTVEGEAPPAGAATSSQHTSSTHRGSFPSKAATRLATENAFRPVNVVYRNANLIDAAGSAAPGGATRAVSDAVPGPASRAPLGKNDSRRFETPSGRNALPPFNNAGAQSNTGRKRGGSSSMEDGRPQKRSNTGGELLSSQNRGGPSSSRDGASSQDNPSHAPWQGSAFRRGESSTAPESGSASRARNETREDFLRRSREINDPTSSSSPWALNAPRRLSRAPTTPANPFSDRNREAERPASNTGPENQSNPPRRAPTLTLFSDRPRDGNRRHTPARAPAGNNAVPRDGQPDDMNRSFGELSLGRGGHRSEFRPPRTPGGGVSWSASSAGDRAPPAPPSSGGSRPDSQRGRGGRGGRGGDQPGNHRGGANDYRHHPYSRRGGPRPRG